FEVHRSRFSGPAQNRAGAWPLRILEKMNDFFGNRKLFLNEPLEPLAATHNSGMPLGTVTITVPAILSCHDCFPRSQPAQKNPSPKTSPEKMAAAARTSATPTSTGRPSRRTNLIPTTIPPTVVPLHAHIAT